MPTPRTSLYTYENLTAAVAAANSLGEVLTNLGPEDTPQRRSYASQRIKALGVDTSRFPKPGQLSTDDDLREAVADSVTMVEVAAALGAKPLGPRSSAEH